MSNLPRSSARRVNRSPDQPRASLGYVKDTATPKGLGVFALQKILPGEVIEVCPVLKLNAAFTDLPVEIQNVVFGWDILAGMPGVLAVVLGYGGIYNYANPANARYRASADGQYMVVTAASRIKKNEEITINYNASAGEPWSAENNWFLARDIAMYAPGDGIGREPFV